MKIFSLVFAFILFSCFFQTPLSADVKQENLEDYRAKGLEAQQKGCMEDALAYYKKASSLDENRADIYNDLGIVCERMGNVYGAKNYYFKAIDLDKNYLPPYLNLAYLHKHQGDLAQAVKYFKVRIQLGDPNDPWTKEAVDQLRSLSSDSPALKQWLQGYEAGVLEGEVSPLVKKLKDEEEKAFLDDLAKVEKYVQQGKAYDESEMYEQALAQYDKALAITPESPSILECRRLALSKLKAAEVKKLADSGLEKFKSGDMSSSKEDFRQILAIIPDE